MLHARNETKVLATVSRHEYDEADVLNGQTLGADVLGIERNLRSEIQS